MRLLSTIQCLGTLFAIYKNEIEKVISEYYAVCQMEEIASINF
jgi:hypothetical protein